MLLNVSYKSPSVSVRHPQTLSGSADRTLLLDSLEKFAYSFSEHIFTVDLEPQLEGRFDPQLIGYCGQSSHLLFYCVSWTIEFWALKESNQN